jgi:hypothetical protein
MLQGGSGRVTSGEMANDKGPLDVAISVICHLPFITLSSGGSGFREERLRGRQHRGTAHRGFLVALALVALFCLECFLFLFRSFTLTLRE